MDFLAAAGAVDLLALDDAGDEVVPLARRRGSGEAVDAGGAQGADGVALAAAVAGDEGLDGGLMGAVVGEGPEGVGLVEGAVVEDDLMDGAG